MNLESLTCISESLNLDEYLSFVEYIKSTMTHPEWLGDFTKEDLKFMLNNGSKIWIYYLDDEPVCSMMLIPADEKSISKFELDIDFKKTVDYGPMMVSPKFIGNNLQYQMLKELNNYSLSLSKKYAITTIHPDNIYSVNNILKDNFKFVNQKEFKRGIRNIYLKKLTDNMQ